MRTVTLNVAPDGTIVIPADVARLFGLTPYQAVVIERHNDVVLLVPPEEAADRLLDELDGCLGVEQAEDYNFDLKIGGLYEAR